MTAPACPACGSSKASRHERVAEYTILRCAGCGLFFSDPMKAGDPEYYQHHLVYDSVSDQVAAQHLASVDNALNRALIRKLPAGARLLDIGCGYGAFVAFAHRHGMDAYGVDFNEQHIEAGRRAYALGDRLQVGRTEQLPGLFIDRSYDMVSLFEVIEHVEDPRGLLAQAGRLLKPGGLLVLSCPNEARWQPAGRIFVDYPPHHLTRWRPDTLTRLLQQLGFSDVAVRVDASVRDILWTAYVNRSAHARVNRGKTATEAQEPRAGSARSWKHVVFDAAGIALKPFDLVLRAMGIGTLGMRVMARRSVEG